MSGASSSSGAPFSFHAVLRSGTLAGIDRGAPISYLILNAGTPVYASDDERIGEVKRVNADESVDIFDGIVVGTSDGDRYVVAADVEGLYERAVVLRVAASTALGDDPDREAPPALEE